MCIATIGEFCKTHHVTACNILLAVSGGSDSIALLHLFVNLREELSLHEIGVVHVNHGLRGDASDREEAFVAACARNAGCRFFTKRLRGKSLHDSGVEEWAREQRYRFFAAVQKQQGYRFIATGHTADDQAETVLMHISRGCGLTGLCGMQPIREDGVIRPLLTVRKQALQAWLRNQGGTWYDDASNDDVRYTRNRIRHTILPRLMHREPHAVEKLVAVIMHFQKQRDFLNPLVNKWITDHVLVDGQHRFVLKKHRDRQEDRLAAEGIARLFRTHAVGFDKRHIDTFLKEMKRTSGCFLLQDGWHYYPGRDTVEVVLKTGKDTAEKERAGSRMIQVPGVTACEDAGYCFSVAVMKREKSDVTYDKSNWTVFLDREKTGPQLLCRPVEKSDTFQPLGYDRAVSAVQFLKNQKVSRYYRRFTGAVTDQSGSLIWIPGIAVGQRYRVTAQTQTIVRISCRRIS